MQNNGLSVYASTLKKFGGHIALCLSVRPFVHTSRFSCKQNI